MSISPNQNQQRQAPSAFIAPQEGDDIAGHAHRQVIGWLGIALPFVIWLLAGLRPIDRDASWSRLDSISAYFHSGAVAAFVGVLVTLGVYLFAYQGYANSDNRWDRIAARVAGLCAVSVALFPMQPDPGACPNPQWMTEGVSHLHFGSAALLFTTFACIALFLFRKKSGTPTKAKRTRNAIYLACGLSIIGALLFIVWQFIPKGEGEPAPADIFWPEAVAIWAFGISWLVKGRADFTIKAAVRKLKPA
ncbi:MAG: DUF998 domain-containing protein [Flavobacteriales bacterium]|nr:MAG: DUF998 domain-containing protein [Flavobacteriales bacterium]